MATTREDVIAAARAVLSAREPATWSMSSVADAAGVTRMTLYNQFGSRVKLVEAVLTEVVARDRMDRLVEGTSACVPGDALRSVIATTCRFWHSERHLLRRLFSDAYADADLSRLLARREGWRRDQFVTILERAGAELHPDVEPRSAADLLVAVTSFPTYDRLGAVANRPLHAAALLERCLTGVLR